MQYLLRRLIERAIIARRSDESFIRGALSDTLDVHGRVRGVVSDTVRDDEQHYPFNLYGRFTADGTTTPGERLVMMDGDAAGKEWELLSTIGNRLRVVGAVDLAAEGVAVGDHYQVFRAQEDRAFDWFSKAAMRCVIGYPSDPATAPCYTVNLDTTGEQTRPVGNIGRQLRGEERPNGNPSRELIATWDRRYSIQAVAITPDAVDWMTGVFEAVYRQSVRLFDRYFNGDVKCEIGMLQRIEDFGCFSREATISGSLNHRTIEELEWMIDETVTTVPTPRRSVYRTSPSTSS